MMPNQDLPDENWQSAKEIAEWLGKTPGWVKENGDALGGERDGPGRTARWLFLRSRVEAALPSLRNQPAPPRPAAGRTTMAKTKSTNLLPIKGVDF
jgi:hypothetical protein